MSCARGDGKKKKVCRLKICRRVEDAAPSVLLQGSLPAAGHLDRTHCSRTRNVGEYFGRFVVDPSRLSIWQHRCSVLHVRSSWSSCRGKHGCASQSQPHCIRGRYLREKTGSVDHNDHDVKTHCILLKYKYSQQNSGCQTSGYMSKWGGKFRTITRSREWGWKKKE